MDLYYNSSSPPCRSVLMVAYILRVKLNLKPVDLMAREQYHPDFLKINPQHKVPTLDDEGFYVTESRAICAYLVDKFGQNDSLYPENEDERALVDSRLYFDASILMPNFTNLYVQARPLTWYNLLLFKFKLTFYRCPLFEMENSSTPNR